MRALIVVALIASGGCADDPAALAVVDATAFDAGASRHDAGTVVGAADASPHDGAPDAASRDAEPDPTDAAVSDLGPPPPDAGTTVARHPIVLVHGWAASDTVLGFSAVGTDLTSAGHRVLVASLPPFDTPAVRASFLAKQIEPLLAGGAAKVNIIAHSQGGLDARHLISAMGYGDRVASLTTIATPHRGTAVADVVLGLQSGASTAAIDALGAIFGARVSDIESDPDVRASLRALSETDAIAFNAAHPDDPRVHYQSWAGLSNVRGIPSRNDETACETMLFDPSVRDVMDRALVPLAAMAAHGLRVWPNDGMVPVSSAKWGHYRGCLPADHADEVGAFDDLPPDAVTGFDYLAFYRSVARELADRGF